MGKYDTDYKKQDELKRDVFECIKKIAKEFQENPEHIAEMLAFGSRFYKYSPNNTMLIFAQNRGATYVQSYAAWKKEGYHVLKGEKGIKVLVPVVTTLLEVDGGYVPLSRATKEQVEKFKNNQLNYKSSLSFKVGNTFDISQTNYPPEDYPKLYSVGYQDKEMKKVIDGLVKFSEEVLQCKVERKNMRSISIRGSYNRVTGEIQLNNLLKETEIVSTLAHEIGHAITFEEDGYTEKSLEQNEFEADAIGIMIQSQMGIELTDGRKLHLATHFQRMEEGFKNKKKEENIEMEFSMDEILNDIYTNYRKYAKKIEEYVDQEIGIQKIKNQFPNLKSNLQMKCVENVEENMEFD